MKHNYIALLLVSMLFVFGCTGPAAPSENAAEPGAPSGEVAPAEGSGMPSGAEETPPAEEGSSGTDLSDLMYAELVALGTPLECDYTITSDEETFVVKGYMKGGENIRMEMPLSEEMVTDPDCDTMVYISKPESFYFGCKGTANYPTGTDCNWMKFDTAEEPSETDAAGPATFDASWEDLPSTQISCKPWIYDAAMFDTPGKVCDLDVMFTNMPPVE